MPAVQMGRVLVPAVQKGVQCTQKITDVEIHPRKKDQLLDQNLVLTEASCIAYPLKELSSRSIFHYNSQMGWCQYDLEQKVKCHLI